MQIVKIGKGPSSKRTLSGQILEEVEAYKYLGEMMNDKGNLSAHITELERKIQAATQSTITETGNKEFKGIKMEAVWQLVDSIIMPILTYGAEWWEPTQTELQTIMNKALKILLFLPQQTSTSILQETGYLPTEREIKRKGWCRTTEYSTKRAAHPINQWQQTKTACGKAEQTKSWKNTT